VRDGEHIGKSSGRRWEIIDNRRRSETYRREEYS
jgi:hypothetical protein